jgi:diguanylate cyclase (GGDEF)-like protein/PAS domain S-box-containing protein
MERLRMTATIAADDAEVLQAVLDSLPLGVYLVDRHGKIVLWNTAAERITGHLRQDLIGHTAQGGFLGYTDDQDNVLDGANAPLWIAINKGSSNGTIVNLRHKQGHRVSVRLFTSPIRDARGSVTGAVECLAEMPSSAKWVERHSALAEYGCIDEHSGVLSHEMILLHLREALAMFAQKPVPFSILCIGIDRLEEMKRRDGPAVLAPMLRAVGLTLENSLRPTDFIGRWGENEFLAILTECSREGLEASAERLRRMISGVEVEWWGDPLRLTASLGGATAITGDDADSIVARAEKALQEAGKEGGNRLQVHTRISHRA